MGVRGIRGDSQHGGLDQLIMATLMAFMMVFTVSVVVNLLVL
jgi:hypothetical protein